MKNEFLVFICKIARAPLFTSCLQINFSNPIDKSPLLCYNNARNQEKRGYIMFQYHILYKNREIIVFSRLDPPNFMYRHFVTEILSVTSEWGWWH